MTRYVVQRSGAHYGEFKWDVHEVGEDGAIESSIVARSSVRQDADNVCAALNGRGATRVLARAVQEMDGEHYQDGYGGEVRMCCGSAEGLEDHEDNCWLVEAKENLGLADASTRG